MPPRVFDAHVHSYRTAWWKQPPLCVQKGPAEAGPAAHAVALAPLLPGRTIEALTFPFPFSGDGAAVGAANQWLAGQLQSGGAGLALVSPATDPDQVAEQVRRLGLRGLKPYHLYASTEPTWEARLPDYLPEPLLREAHGEGWVVMLHLVRARGVADADNQYWIRRYCETAPQAQFVLAHCARGFNCYHLLEGLPPLADLPNLWVDVSGVANATAILACLQILGPERVLFGTDFPVSHLKGTNYPLADSFVWVDDSAPPAPPAYAPGLQLPLLGVECLRAAAAAVRLARLTDDQIESFFCRNALRLLGRE